MISGAQNPISLTREYFQEYSCEFNLLYYPFDTQICEIELSVQGKTENFLKLVKDGKGIAFKAPRKLVEYEIQAEDLQVKSEENISIAAMRFVFARRFEYHVANTFLQTFVLMMVGYMTFYFDVNNFTDRIMVSLTTMLVVATITREHS